MLVPMKPEAIRSFRLFTELSMAFGVIDKQTFEERMKHLGELLGGSDGPTAKDKAAKIQETRGELVEGAGEEHAHRELLNGEAEKGGSPPDWLQLIPAGSIAHLARWQFVKGDPDPHPSVPHGHDNGKTFPKLDPYLGWIHASTTKKCGRLSRDDTRALWNDARFRDFASAALLHFIRENPSYVWRVPHPKRLPRHR